MVIRIIILSSLLFSSQIVQANFLSEFTQEWVRDAKESSRKSCLKRYSSEDVEIIDSVLTNKDPNKSGILMAKGDNPAGWMTVSDKAGLKLLCHDSRSSRYVEQNRLEPMGLHMIFFCGYRVYACLMQPRAGDHDSNGPSNEGPADGGGSDNGDSDDGGSDDGGSDDGGSDDGGSDDGGSDDGGSDDGGSDDGGSDDGGAPDGPAF